MQVGLGVGLRWMLDQRPHHLACVLGYCGPPGVLWGALGLIWSNSGSFDRFSYDLLLLKRDLIRSTE